MSGELLVIIVVGGLPIVAAITLMYFADRAGRRARNVEQVDPGQR